MDALTSLRGRQRFLVRAKPNAKETRILDYDQTEDVFHVAVKAPPVEGKANAELERFFTKLLKAKVVIKSGHGSKTKILGRQA